MKDTTKITIRYGNEDQVADFDRQAVETLFNAVQSRLPEGYRSIRGMAQFFEGLGNVLHGAQFMADVDENKLLSREYREAHYVKIHADAKCFDYLRSLVEAFSNESAKPNANFLNRGELPAILRREAEQLGNWLKFLNDRNELQTLEGYKNNWATEEMAWIFNMIRSDKGHNIKKLLETIAATLEKNPIVVLNSQQARQVGGAGGASGLLR